MAENGVTAAFTVFKDKILRNKKLTAILAAGLAGILLIALSSIDNTGEKAKTQDYKQTESLSQSAAEIQTELESFLENIDGTGKVKVMITFETDTETVYAKDTEENSSSQGENEERKYKSEHIIIKNDSGESGLEVKQIYPKVRGVAVICENADNPVIREQIVSAVCALFDINSTQISVASKAA
ncbi:MAG: hypothetical protein ACI4W6_07445 [Acutalibacteraceae bacterium]